MLKLNDFIKKCKLPILWTTGYIFVLWAIMHILFNFDIFSAHHWIRASHAHLRGLAGFTFGILVLAAIPLYVATTTIVIRTQKPLLALPVPKFIAGILAKLFPKSAKTDTDKEPEVPATPTPITPPEPDNIPAEMRGVFMRARAHPNRINTPICTVCSTNPNIYPNTDDTPTAPDFGDEMPLPMDFDSDENMTLPTEPGTPIFHDIDFYNTTNESENIPDNDIIAHFKKTNRNFDVLDNDIVVTDNAVIAIHDDNDFWIMDEPTWFAAGKTRESPITELLNIAQANNISAILYLGTTNIMDLDKKRDEWKNKGIKIITDISNL